MSRGHIVSGGRLRDSANQIASKRLRAERRQCPKCGRKSALKFESEDFGDGYGYSATYCRWIDQGKCDYQVVSRRTPTKEQP